MKPVLLAYISRKSTVFWSSINYLWFSSLLSTTAVKLMVLGLLSLSFLLIVTDYSPVLCLVCLLSVVPCAQVFCSTFIC